MPTTHKTSARPATKHTVASTTTHSNAAAHATKADSAAKVADKKPAKPKADDVVKGGRTLGKHPDPAAAGAGHHASDVVAVRAAGGASKNKNIIHDISTRKQFDSLFAQGASVTAGAPTELKFLIDRKSHEIYFVPPKFPFHFTFYKDVLKGTMDNATFDQRAYDRPDRDFIAGTVTAYDSYVDPKSGKKGQICFSLWPTDRFDAKLLKETQDAVAKGLSFRTADQTVAFRPGGPKQDKLVADNAAALKTAGIEIKNNLEISQGLKFMALSKGDALGKLVVIDKGAAMPELGRTDIAIFLGDVPPTAPPVAAIITTQVQTYNSHLGIKYRQDNTPYFYKALSESEIAGLKALNGKPVLVKCDGTDGTITAATQKQADDYLKKIKPQGDLRLAPNMKETRALDYDALAKMTVGADGKWNPEFLSTYGRKVAGLVELYKLSKSGALDVSGPGEPKVVTPLKPGGIPCEWYASFVKTAVDKSGVTFSQRIKTMTSDARFKSNDDWRADQLKSLRKDIEKADMPKAMLANIRAQVALPYIKEHPGATSARLRSSAPVVEDSGPGNAKNKLPNMAGAFDSHSGHWDVVAGNPDKTADNAAAAIGDALMKEYSSVWNDRAVSELLWHNVDMDEGSVAMSLAVMPPEADEKANGVIRVNSDLAGFFSITGETQFGENLVTNPEAGATPDTWIDGNYDILGGEAKQDIEYERVSNQKSSDPARTHAYSDAEISVAYKAMKVIRDHFAALEGKKPEDYNDECETKVLADGSVQFKQERPWVE